MANAIGAFPLGSRGQFQPYGSGGYGSITMRFSEPLTATDTSPGMQNTGGGNIGGGLMAFAGKVGLRADFRYYRARTISSTTQVETTADQATQDLLSGLGFWRTNIGVAFQW
jgi:hypothetical protein